MLLKNKIAATLGLAAAASLANAGNLYVGVGLGLFGSGEEEVETDIYGESATFSEDFSPTSTDFKVGYSFNEKHRAEVSFVTIDVEYDDEDFQSEEYSGFDIEYNYVFDGNKFKPYLGAGLGFYTYVDSDEWAGEDLEGNSVNLLGGLLYQINDNVEFDAFYKYRGIVWDEIVITDGFSSAKLELTSSIGLFGAGVKVHF